MYRRPKFLEVLLDVRREMSAEADYDVELFAELTRSGYRKGDALTRPARMLVVTEAADDEDQVSVEQEHGVFDT